MRFVAINSAEKQGRAIALRTHQRFVRQRTRLINTLRGHLTEFGLVARKPRMMAAVALASKMARMIRALTAKQENYRMA